MKLLLTLLLFATLLALAPLGSATAGLSEGRAAYARGDYSSALAELTPLAKAGNAHAQRMLGAMYRQGHGVAKNAERALHWTREAVKQGDGGGRANIPLAQYRLGTFFLEGLGGTRDRVRAFVWYTRAAANERAGGLAAHAAKARDKIARQLSETEKARGTAMLRRMSALAENTPRKPAKKSTGTGFIVSADGYILTNNHVIAGCVEVHIKPLIVPVIAADAERDLALLKVGANFKRFATFREGDIRKGESVVVAGFPLHGVLGSDFKITTDTVSGLTGPGNNKALLQLSAPIQKGNSGGPLLDLSVHVVGVVVSKLDALKLARATGDIPQNVNFAIKGNVARDFMTEHGVVVVAAQSGADLPPADVAERAQLYTALIECWK